MIHCTCRPSN